MAFISQYRTYQISSVRQSWKGSPCRPCMCFQGTGYSFTLYDTQRLRPLKLHLSSERLQRTGRQPDKYGAVPCALLAEGSNHHWESFQSRASNLLQRGSAPLQTFPWEKFSTKLMQNLADAVWVVGKWLVIPILIVTALREVVFTVSTSKELFIPIGLLAGTMLAGILKETAATLGTDFQDGALPWHLATVGLFFALAKVIAPKYPIWVRAFLVHFANGGLWQTIRFSISWKTSKEGNQGVEEAA